MQAALAASSTYCTLPSGKITSQSKTHETSGKVPWIPVLSFNSSSSICELLVRLPGRVPRKLLLPSRIFTKLFTLPM